MLALAVLFGVYAIIHGTGLIIGGIRGRDNAHRAMSILGGLLGIAAGILALLLPGITVLALGLLVGVWAMVMGVTEIATVFRYHPAIRDELLLVVAGVLSIVAGVLILAHPIAGAFGIAILLGAYALVYGLLLVLTAIRVRARSANPFR